LTASNFGGRDTVSDDVIVEVVRTSNNFALNAQRRFLPTVGKKSKLEITDLFNGVISDNALPGSEVFIEAKFTYPGDTINASYSELVSFRSKVTVNPEIYSSLSFNSKVEWRKWKPWPFKWVYRSHGVRVKLKGIRNHIPGNYDVKTEILKGDKYISITSSTIQIVSPGADQESEGVVTYKFKKDAKDQEVSLRFTISYEGEVVSTNIANIKVD